MNQTYQLRLAQNTRWFDLLLLNGIFGLAYWAYFPFDPISDTYLILQLTLNLTWLALTSLLQTYALSRHAMSTEALLRRFLRAVLLHVLTITAFLYFSKYGESVSRLVLGGTMGAFALTGALGRVFIVQWLRNYRRAGHNESGYLTVGNCELGHILQQRFAQRQDLGVQHRGTFEFGGRALDDELLRLETLIEDTKPDSLYCCLTTLTPEQIQGIIELGERQRAHIRLVPDFRGFLPYQATLNYHDVVPVIDVSTRPYSNVTDETYKRAFDLLFSVTVMLLGAPVFALVAVAVKVFSPGPVFFRQERTGRWGQLFYIYKFRTMRTDADTMGLQHSQGDYDPRVTPIGRFLRKTRLDELPQFINVIKGDMSVVGPRPLYRYDVEMLMAASPIHFKKLLTVKPGITSIGQLKVGYADSLTLNLKRMSHDLYYLRKYSLWYDLYLIGLTVQVMVLRRGK
jgi:exopolysaccharide biosynthesis polyprenyl glycosylphosphotransferase